MNSAQKRIQQASLALLAFLALYLCYTIIRPFLYAIIAAIALAILFQPLHQAILARVRNPSWAAGLSVLAVVILIVVPALWLGGALVGEIRVLYSSLASKSAADGGWEMWILHRLERPLAYFGIETASPEFSLKTAVLGWLDAASATLLRIVRGALGNVAGFLLDSVVTLFTLFFLLRDGHAIRQHASEVLPLDRQQTERLFTEIGRTVIANMYGILAVALVQGGLIALIFALLGLPSPLLWGLVAGLCSMIPLLGPPLVWVPAAIYLLSVGQYAKAAILVAFSAGVVGMADNFIRPYVISGHVNLHPLLVFFALLGGANAFGVMGLFIGPAVLSVTISLVELLRSPRVSETSTAPLT
ncbi:MAG: AI-2E family transporter [Bryobacteraceae bacterium]|nr:AI-2E family transporter [Bryobacteraceae bacterium]MDW8377843.1 AI-2E family transporter [Bryobacterales bacterium]